MIGPAVWSFVWVLGPIGAPLAQTLDLSWGRGVTLSLIPSRVRLVVAFCSVIRLTKTCALAPCAKFGPDLAVLSTLQRVTCRNRPHVTPLLLGC